MSSVKFEKPKRKRKRLIGIYSSSIGFLCGDSEGIMFSLVSTSKTPITGVHWAADCTMYLVNILGSIVYFCRIFHLKPF